MAKTVDNHGTPVSKKEAERLRLNPGVTPKGYQRCEGVDEGEGCGSPYCSDCYEPIETSMGWIDRAAPDHCRTSCSDEHPNNAGRCTRCDFLELRQLAMTEAKNG